MYVDHVFICYSCDRDIDADTHSHDKEDHKYDHMLVNCFGPKASNAKLQNQLAKMALSVASLSQRMKTLESRGNWQEVDYI